MTFPGPTTGTFRLQDGRLENIPLLSTVAEFMGNPAVVAGVVIAVTGFGCFDGSWFVESCEHKIGSGYKTSVEIRKTLKY